MDCQVGVFSEGWVILDLTLEIARLSDSEGAGCIRNKYEIIRVDLWMWKVVL